VADTETVAGAGLGAGIRTFVIGVFSKAEKDDASKNLDRVATRGGSEKAFIIDTDQNVEQEFLATLNKVREKTLSCELALPQPDGGIPDYGKVNVEYTAGSGGSLVIPYTAGADQCDAVKGGWHYDVEPSKGKPSQVMLCPASCKRAQEGLGGHLDVVQGCKTIVILK